MRDPRVNVEVALYRPYYILGEVKKSGEYPYRLGLTVMDAIASAGGFTYRANENKVFLRRAGRNTEEIYALDAPSWFFPATTSEFPSVTSNAFLYLVAPVRNSPASNALGARSRKFASFVRLFSRQLRQRIDEQNAYHAEL